MKKTFAAIIAAGAVLGLAACTSGDIQDTGTVIGGDTVRVVTIKTDDERTVICATWRRSIDCDWEGAR
ncbi:hypothetical protein MUN77_01470 [Leucobacter allii]|uniref:hypothetical protein n=1 Tax=Leucobacter allii TaxID=2932247 RepID=UPI001FCFC1B5|nr:hypothetical protein [Leucobacter allii]UOR02028.1 hypothetical protein MUN77_01470 [Leucobacter allii]